MLLANMMRDGLGSAKGIRDDEWDGLMMAGGSHTFVWIHLILALITWIVVLAVLISIARWFWFKGNGEKK